MYLDKGFHLTYCTNIHSGESWNEVYSSLKTYLPPLKKKLSPNSPFGIGLRLSNQASKELLKSDVLSEFKEWLLGQGLYVFTMNGFPYGEFHNKEVKDQVHRPDWTKKARLKYTIRLAKILAELLPVGLDGGISTSPLSYKPWMGDKDDAKIESVYRTSTENLISLVESLLEIKQITGKTIHIDIEPEPDGLLENSKEVIAFYKDWLIPVGLKKLPVSKDLTAIQAEKAIYEHLQVCYDVCHFALAYEKPSEVISAFQAKRIRIGKIQLSAALKTHLPEAVEKRAELAETLSTLAESTYLHQVVERNSDGNLTHYPDLTFALQHIRKPNAVEWRTHFHVPLFTDQYNGLHSTNEDVVEVLKLLQDESITNHLEVETYTWEVLPNEIKEDLAQSIQRELEWVLKNLNTNRNAENSRSGHSGSHQISNR